MMTGKIFFVRHGESQANTKRIVSNRVSDVAPLTDLGRRQALQVREVLRERGTITTIYTSPIQRARETAEILANRDNIRVIIADGLREPFCGEIEGRGDPEAWRLHAEQEHQWRIGNHDHRIPGGESLSDVAAPVHAVHAENALRAR